MFSKLEQRSWLNIGAGRDKTAREYYRGLVEFAVRQHYRIGQLQGGFKPSALDGRMRQISHGPDDPAQQKPRLVKWQNCWRQTDGGQFGSWPVRPDYLIRRSCTSSKNACTCAKSHLVGSRTVWLKSSNDSDTSRLGCIWNVAKRKGMLSCIVSYRWMRRGRELTGRKWNGSLMSAAITGHPAKPKCGRIPAMLRLWSFSPS